MLVDLQLRSHWGSSFPGRSRSDVHPMSPVQQALSCSELQRQFLILRVLLAEEDRGELVGGSAGSGCILGIDPPVVPGAIPPGGELQRRRVVRRSEDETAHPVV